MSEIKQCKHIAIRLPNWLGDICMALPIIRAMQSKALAESPQLQFSFLMLPHYVSLMEKLNITGECVALPPKSSLYFAKCLAWRGRFDAHILFTNSQRGDMEAWLMGAKQRFGIATLQRKRRLLTDRYTTPTDFDQETLHQTLLWQDFARHFNWLEQAELSPFKSDAVIQGNNIALICGSSNAPEKRWHVANWQQLTKQLVQQYDQVTLLGTHEDRAICDQVKKAVADSNKIVNLAGETSLASLVDVMRQQSLIIGNDTGGLHLANTLGVPVIGLFGPTNPTRTKPIHSAAVTIMQSPHGTINGKMSDISVDDVLSTLAQQA